MSIEAEEIVDAIRAAYRERTGAATLPEALDAAPRTECGRWAIARVGDEDYAALMDGPVRLWWRQEFRAPEWQPITDTALLPSVGLRVWVPADPSSLLPGFTLPVS